MKESACSDAVTWALETFPQLQEVGENGTFRGGFKFGAGSMRYRRMSFEVASFGKRVGVDLLRPSSKALTQVLHPLPPGIHLAISDKLSYKNSKHLPSVAVADTNRRGESLESFADQHQRERFLFLTLPASDHRLTVSELDAEIDLFFKKEREFENTLREEFGDAVEVVALRLELPYDPETRTFHPHFHAIATCDDSIALEDFQAWLREYTVNAGLMSVSSDASLVDRKDVGRVARYVFKPCLAAHKMAQTGHEAEFRIFVGNLRKRVSRTRGALATYERERIAANKASRSSESNSQRNSERSQRGKDKAKCGKLPNDAPEAPQNVLCGVSKSIVLPGGRKGIWSTVKNYTPCSGGLPDRFGGVSTVELINAAALERWEANTSREYSLKEFIRPIAGDLRDLLNKSNVQYCTITCSQEIIDLLQEIEVEEAAAIRKVREVSEKEEFGQAVRRKFWGKLKQISSYFFTKLNFFKDWIKTAFIRLFADGTNTKSRQ